MEYCKICGCELNRGGKEYGKQTLEGRSHATKHHYVAKRFFGRSANRKGELREPVFKNCPWGFEGQFEEFCYECHEELLHNPVLLPNDIKKFAELVRIKSFNENQKTASKDKIAHRIELLHKVIEKGIRALLKAEK